MQFLSCSRSIHHSTMEDMAASQLPLTLIVAATVRNGIGSKGTLPWPMLKKEMAYFARVTKRVVPPTIPSDAPKDIPRRNAVIMGRKTWDSIPPNFRPLKDRTNIVISSKTREQLASPPGPDVLVAADIAAGLRALEARVQSGEAPPATAAFVIGGASVYEAALRLPQTKRILLTRIRRDYECDTWFPVDLDGDEEGGGGDGDGATVGLQRGWRRRSLAELRRVVGEEVPEGLVTETVGEGEVQFEYRLYERS